MNINGLKHILFFLILGDFLSSTFAATYRSFVFDSCGNSISVKFGSSSISLQTQSANGFHFDKWCDNNSKEKQRDIRLSPSIIWASFEKDNYNIDAKGDKRCFIEISYTDGRYVLQATAATSYRFVKWSDGLKDNPRYVSMDTLTKPLYEYFAYFTINEPMPYQTKEVDGNSINVKLKRYDYDINAIANENKLYTFEGWCDGVEENSRKITNLFEEISFHSLFKKHFKVTFVDTANINTPDPIVITAGAFPVATLNKFPELPGYTFDGYYGKKNGNGKKYFDSLGVNTEKIDSTMTVYSKWIANSYAIKFFCSANTDIQCNEEPYHQTLYYDKKDALFENIYQRQTTLTLQYNNGQAETQETVSYVFLGWTDNKYNQSVKFEDRDSIMNLSSTNKDTLSLYGLWEKPHKELPTPVFRGHRFDGWFNNDNVLISSPNDVILDKDTLFFAKWSPMSYKISYLDVDGNPYSGNNLNNLPQTHTFGTETELIDGIRLGYIFKGWYTSQDTTTNAITKLGATDSDCPITLYAYWEPIHYSLQFFSTLHTNQTTMQNQLFTFDNLPQKLNKNLFERKYNVNLNYNYPEGPIETKEVQYSFVHWKRTDDLSQTYADEDIITTNLTDEDNKIITLEACWQPTALSVLTPPTRKNYVFDHWFVKTNAGDINIGKTIQDFVPLSDTNIYAVWYPATYNITYLNVDGSTYAGSNLEDLPKTHQFETPTSLVDGNRTGYFFKGWVTTLDLSGETVTVLGATDIENDITLYAKWEPIHYSITFISSEHTNQTLMEEQIFEYDQPQNLNKNLFERKYVVSLDLNFGNEPIIKNDVVYTFAYWERTDDATKRFSDAQLITNNLSNVDGDIITLKAYWNKGSIDISPPVRKNYIFDYWYIISKGDTIPIGKHISPFTPTCDTTLYAHWINDRSVSVSFHVNIRRQDTVGLYNSTLDSSYVGQGYNMQDVAELVTIPAFEGFDFVDSQYVCAISDSCRILKADEQNNVTVVLRFARKQYSLIWDYSGGIDDRGQSSAHYDVYHGEHVAKYAPKSVSLKGFVFNGWSIDYSQMTMSGDLTIKAKWDYHPYVTTNNPTSYCLDEPVNVTLHDYFDLEYYASQWDSTPSNNITWSRIEGNQVYIPFYANMRWGEHTLYFIFGDSIHYRTEPCSTTVRLNYPSSLITILNNKIVTVNIKEESFSSFQWLINNTPIQGAIDPYYYNPDGLSYGEYAVIVNDNYLICALDYNGNYTTNSDNLYISILNQNDYRITPNPTYGVSTIELINHPHNYNHHHVTLYDLAGRKVLDTYFSGQKFTINLSTLPPQMYLMSVDGIKKKLLKL